MPSGVNSNPVWLIVGGSRGIGLELVKQVAESGAHVIATARSLQRAPGLQSLLQTHGALLTVVTLDVTAAASVKQANGNENLQAAAVEAAASHPGGIDYLLVAAGTIDQHVKPALEMELDEFKRVFDVNVFGAFAAIQAFFPLVKAKEGGRKVVAVISSSEGSVSPVAASARDVDAPHGPFDAALAPYRASKAALVRFTMQLANEYKKDGVVFTALYPGAIDTDMARTVMAQVDDATVAMAKTLMTPVEESVRGMVALLTAATAETLNGRFVDGNGSDMPW